MDGLSILRGATDFAKLQVKDLPALRVGLTGHLSQRRTAGHALRRLVDACLIRDGHLLQRRAWMARLASGLSARGLTQRTRRFCKTVTGRGLAAVAAIRGQLIFERLDPLPATPRSALVAGP